MGHKMQNTHTCQAWWPTPLIPVLRGHRQENLCEFEANLVYRASSRTVRTTTQRKAILKDKTKKHKKIQVYFSSVNWKIHKCEYV